MSADTIVPGGGSLTVAPNDATALAAWGQRGPAANPQQLNRYTYVLNNPLKNTDPTGHANGHPVQVAITKGEGGGGSVGGGGGGGAVGVQVDDEDDRQQGGAAGGSGGGTSSTSGGNVNPAATAAAEGATVHPNSASSTAINHVYEITRTNLSSGETSTYKYGISSKPLNPDGTSPRALEQVIGNNSVSRNYRYDSRVLAYNIRGRGLALKIEQGLVDRYAANNPLGYRGPPGNKQPKPTPR